MTSASPYQPPWVSEILVDLELGLAAIVAVEAVTVEPGVRLRAVVALVRNTLASLRALRGLSLKLDAAFEAANELVRTLEGGRLAPMSLTLVLLDGAQAGVGHVGACRLQLVRLGRAEQLTMDHTAGNLLTAGGFAGLARLDRPEALVGGLGVHAAVRFDRLPVELVGGDVLVLSSPTPTEPALTLSFDGPDRLRSARWPRLSEALASTLGSAPGSA